MKPQQATVPHQPRSRQVVDPFVAARPVSALPAAAPKPQAQRPAQAYRPPAGPLHVRYMADVQAPRATAAASRPGTAPAPKPAASHAIVRPVAAKPGIAVQKTAAKKPKAASRPWSFEEQETWRDRPGKVAMLAAGGLLLGALSLFSLELGELAVAVYAVVAFWRRWPSRQAFAVALGMFGGIIVASLVSAWRALADNMAVYAFLLLCIGTVLMWLEMRREARVQTANPALRK